MLFGATNTSRSMDKERVLPILAKNIPRLGKLPWETANSTRPQQIVAIGDERPPHPDEAAWPSFLPAINHVIARLHLKRPLPVEHGGFRGPSKKMLGLTEVQRLIKFPDELSVRAGTELSDLRRRLGLKDEAAGRRGKHEPPVKPMVRRRLVFQGQPLLEERGRGLDVAGRSNPHDFPASRFGIVYMLQDVRRVDEVE
jgi:hypothetical protein